MKRASVVLLVFATGCFNFERRVADCFDGGRCSQLVDGGALDAGGAEEDAGPFVPLDAGHFCVEQWCWESPFPHGTRLNAVAAFGSDSVVVAGEQGMLAEFRDGRWVSYQSLATPDDFWSTLWGTGPDDVFLAGSTRIWRRSDAGWSPRTLDNPEVWRSVTGTRGPGSQVFFGDNGGRIVRYERGNDRLVDVRRLDGAGVVDLEVAHGGQLFALAEPFDGGAQLVRVDGGALVFTDAGVTALFGNDSNLWLAGADSFSVDAELQFTPLLRAVNTGTGASSPVRVVTDEGIETLTGTTFGPDRTQQGVRAIDAAAGAIWAVGEAGLVLRSTSQSQWVDPTQSSLRDRVRALVAFGPDLVAVTDVGLLVRSTDGWISRLSGARFLDGVAFRNRLYVLRSDNTVLELTPSYMVERTFTPGATLARHLWVTAGGALVLVAVNGIFVKSPDATEFTFVTGGPVGGVAIGGSGDVVRVVTGAGAVFQLDFADQPPEAQQVTGVSIPDCSALTRFPSGWAYATGGRDGVGTAVEVFGDDDMRRSSISIPLAGGPVRAFAPSPKGVFAAARGIAEIPVVTGGEVRMLPTRVTNELETVIVWRGRLLAGGEFGTIIQGPAR